MEKQPRHRPTRKFENAKRLIMECELVACPHYGEVLQTRHTWHMRKTIQTLEGPLFVAGKTKKCANAACRHAGQPYYASQAALFSLPKSTYGRPCYARRCVGLYRVAA